MGSVRIDSSEILVVGVLKGLVSEESKVGTSLKEFHPDAIGLSVSKEELSALRDKSVYEDYEMSSLEEVYSIYMGSFGEVRLPTPGYTKALELADDSIPVIPLDMNDADFTEAYIARIGGKALVRESLFTRTIKRRKFRIDSPESFAMDWDRRLNKAKEFRALENARQKHMATTLRSMTRKYSRILALIEYERAAGVERELRSSE